MDDETSVNNGNPRDETVRRGRHQVDWQSVMQIAMRLAQFADYLAKVWHDWTGNGPRWPTMR